VLEREKENALAVTMSFSLYGDLFICEQNSEGLFKTRALPWQPLKNLLFAACVPSFVTKPRGARHVARNLACINELAAIHCKKRILISDATKVKLLVRKKFSPIIHRILVLSFSK